MVIAILILLQISICKIMVGYCVIANGKEDKYSIRNKSVDNIDNDTTSFSRVNGNTTDLIKNNEPVFFASKIGMIANDRTKSEANYLVLKNILSSGGTLVIDDRYYIKNPDINSGLKANYAIRITSYSNNGEIITESSNDNATTLIHAGEADVQIDNVRINGIQAVTLVSNNNDNLSKLHYGKVTIKDCYITGKVRACRILYNDAKTDIWQGGDGIYIINNRFENVTQQSTFSLSYPQKEIVFRNNTVTEFPTVFLTATWDAPSYSDNPIENVLIENNDIFGSATLTKNPRLKYRTPFLLQVRNCEILNNRIESLGAYEANSYFFYASAFLLNCKNNYLKNCVSLHATYYNAIFKAKSGAGYKTFENNQVIIEPSFIADMNKQLDMPFTDSKLLQHSSYNIFLSQQTDKELVFRNNTFDLNSLYQFASKSSSYKGFDAENLVFDGNTIITHELLNDRAAVVNLGKNVKNARIENNIVKTYLSDNKFSAINLVALTDMSTPVVNPINISVKNNKVYTENSLAYIVNLNVTDARSSKLGRVIIRDNTIINKKPIIGTSLDSCFVNAGCKKLVIENNKTN